MGKKTPPFSNYPAWSTAKFFGFLRSNLRLTWNKYPPKWEALNDAYVGKMKNKKTGRPAKHYRCAGCSGVFPAKDVQIDHKIDVGKLKDWSDVEGFVRRLFCHKNDLQVLCKDVCHREKTNKNRKK